MVVPPGRVQIRSADMSDTATITSKQNPLQYVTEELKELRGKGVAPRLRVLEGEQKPVCIFDGKEVINLASNNYLGLTTHKALRKAALDAVKRYGVGAGAVRTIAGTMKIHIELEEKSRRSRTWKPAWCFGRVESRVDYRWRAAFESDD